MTGMMRANTVVSASSGLESRRDLGEKAASNERPAKELENRGMASRDANLGPRAVVWRESVAESRGFLIRVSYDRDRPARPSGADS